MKTLCELESKYLLQTYKREAVVIERGQGCYFWDVEGRRYLDFTSGVGVNALGHSHPRLVAVIQEQATRCLHTSNLFHHPYQGELAKVLAEWSGLARVFFSNSGTEAMELALKAARAAGRHSTPGKWKVIALQNSFHGRTAGALSVTGQEKYRKPFEPLIDGAIFIGANDSRALREAMDSQTLAIVTETIQGEGGIHPLHPAFLEDVRALSERAGALWIADETQCGLGRTGARFAYQLHANIGLPDIVVTAKPLASGLPLGATMFSEEAASAIQPGMHGTTFGGGPLACRVAIETLSLIDKLLPHVQEVGAYLFEALDNLRLRHSVVKEIRGRGLMAGLQLGVAGHPVVRHCLERGLAINCVHGEILRLLPPFIATRNEIDEAIGVLDEVLPR